MKKPFWTSRTLWVNVVMLAVAVLGLDELQALLGDAAIEKMVALQSILNVILRVATTQGVNAGGDS